MAFVRLDGVDKELIPIYILRLVLDPTRQD